VFLAWREIRRAKARFALLSGAVALLVFLILAQYTLQEALIRGFVGGVRNQTAPVLVFDVDGRRTPQASSVPDRLAATVRSVDGVEATAPVWAGTFPIQTGGSGGDTGGGDVAATSVVGYDDPALGGVVDLAGGRLPEREGEVVANAADADRGLGLGATVAAAPGGTELRVVGVADDIGVNVAPTLFTTGETFLALLRERNPDLAELPPPNVLAVRPAGGTDPGTLADRITAADPTLDALTAGDAAERNPGVVSIRQSFDVIFVLFALVVPLVVGLFFLILTLQKADALTLLRAVGSRAGPLVRALLTQVVFVLALGVGLAVALYVPFSSRRVGDLALRFETGAVLTWIAVVAGLGALSALASVRRVLAIDPVAATTGAGVR
jgi:putative ABC transport system permease protein